VLTGVCGPRKNEVTGDRRALQDKEVHNLQSSPYIVRAFRSKMMKWEGHVARMGKMRNAWNI
jgi:hypothetical protein